jgi:hypothetical protein
LVNGALHVTPQSIPAGLDVTVPVPDPVFVTVRLCCWRVNVAVTLRAWVIVT